MNALANTHISHNEVMAIESEFFGKKARERRANRREERQQRKLQKISARGDARAKVAENGGGFANAAAGWAKGLGGVASQVLGGILPGGAGGGQDPMMSNRNMPLDESIPTQGDQPKSNNTTIIIVAVVVVAVVAFVLWKKKKK